MRIVSWAAKQLVDSVDGSVVECVLHDFGITMDVVTLQFETLAQVQLPQSMFAHHVQCTSEALIGESNAIGSALDITAPGQFLSDALNGGAALASSAAKKGPWHELG